MTERLIAKLDRLGAEAGIKEMTPEIYRFAQLLNDDKLKQWVQDVMDQNRDLKIQNRALKAVIDATNMASEPAGLNPRKKK